MSSEPQDLGPCLSAARRGSKDALGQALESCRRYLLCIAHQELDAALQAKGSHSDVVQDTFLEAHRDFERFRGTSAEELRAWLRALLVHRVAKLGRRFRSTQKRSVRREVPLNLLDSTAAGQQGLADRRSTPSALIMAGEQATSLLEALQRLPPDYRRVIQLRYQEQCSFEGIARLMQRTPNAVRLLWLRAIERVRQELQRHES